MKLPLSDRLLACAGFVAPGDRVADIGCDHGYLGIYLLTNGIAKSVIASDINEGPLQSAMRNAQKFGVHENIRFYLSDGARNIPREFDTLICAGMGGDTMVSILEGATWLNSSGYRLILQCQSKTPMLRSYLTRQGWRITEETVLRDGKFLYTIMEVCYQPDYPRLEDWECYFPPVILEHPTKDVPAYYGWVVGGLRIATAYQDDPEKKKILSSLLSLAEQKELAWLKEEQK